MVLNKSFKDCSGVSQINKKIQKKFFEIKFWVLIKSLYLFRVYSPPSGGVFTKDIFCKRSYLLFCTMFHYKPIPLFLNVIDYFLFDGSLLDNWNLLIKTDLTAFWTFSSFNSLSLFIICPKLRLLKKI